MNNRREERGTAGRLGARMWIRLFGLSFLSGLGGGMPMAAHPDERVAATAQRWAARGGAFMSVALGIDVIVRVLVLRQDFRQCWDICLIWMANLFFVCIGMVRNGVRPAGAGGRLSWKANGWAILIIALEIPAILWLIGGISSWREYVIYTALCAVVALIMQLIMRGIYGRWERRTLGGADEEQ